MRVGVDYGVETCAAAKVVTPGMCGITILRIAAVFEAVMTVSEMEWIAFEQVSIWPMCEFFRTRLSASNRA